ncbi:nucleotidyltransferase domain-containing protein [Propionivibrio sp.]|uniref:nucleotidyltransferase domain-containing protein n=1 Tax=Propionivibrio sp. TaxID=2212460 RepID=UPI003BEF8216
MKRITDEILADMARRLVQVADPDKVVLFGSRARGDAQEDSDVDLLVIKPSDQPRHLRALPLYRALRGMGIPKDILWVTPDEVAAWQTVTNHVVSRGLREGRVLYEKKPA